jgi:integrase
MRPSEEIALEVADCDLTQGKVLVSKARVMRHDKDRTKTGEDRLVDLCPRALEVLKRQLALRANLKLAGKVTHENVFFRDDGSQIRNLNDPYDCWRWSLKRLKVRYRDPYSARHPSVSWNLMAGKNILRVAKQHGHSVSTMLTTYAAWTEGATDADVEAIKRAMEQRPRAAQIVLNATPANPPQPPEFGTGLALDSVGRKVTH